MDLGVCYYPEHWPEERWAIDARKMRELGLSVVRIAEFAWSKMEPAEGRFEWDWLDRAIDTLAAEGLKIILGTPTATPPAWIFDTCPEIFPVDEQGRRRGFGSRRHYCSNHPEYQRHSQRIVTAMVERYGKHEAVFAWQIDNELGCHDTARCYCEVCAGEFRRWLKHRYGSLEKVNEAWGTEFWSQTYTSWDQIKPPVLPITEPNPCLVLDYYRFSSDSVVDYCLDQVDIIRAHAPGRLVTTNLSVETINIDYHDLVKSLDLVTWDSYPTGYKEAFANYLYALGEVRPSLAYDAGDPYVTGFCHSLVRGLKQQPFWIMEHQIGNINWAEFNPGVRPGNIRLWSWHAAANGADSLIYFRWRAVRYAQEQMHSAMLNHDATLTRGAKEIQQLKIEEAGLDPILQAFKPARAAILFSYPEMWAVGLQPHRKGFSYLRLAFLYYRAFQMQGIDVDLLPYDADLTDYRLVVAPILFQPDESLVNRLETYVQRGGTLLMGIRSGFKTPTNLVIDQPLPGLLRPLSGCTIHAWHSLPPEIGFACESNWVTLPGKIEIWAEEMEANDVQTQVLVKYADGPFANAAAMTSRQTGQGKTLYLGWYPTLQQAKQIIAKLWQDLGFGVELLNLPDGVVSSKAGNQRYIFNFCEDAQTVAVHDQVVKIPGRSINGVMEE